MMWEMEISGKAWCGINIQFDMANRERVRAAGEKRKLNVRFVYLADDRAEEWCELHWKRREDASDGGE